MSKQKQLKLGAIVDSVGRTIIGTVTQTKTTVDVENPAIINIQVRQDTGQISVQLVPYIFREFIAPNKQSQPITWSFPKSLVVVNKNLEINSNLEGQYTNMFNQPVGEAEPREPVSDTAVVDGEITEETDSSKSDPEVVKLFDDEDDG
jgi:hypothetical protein